jgi:hypothetical protein
MASEDVDELLARRSCPSTLFLFLLRVSMTQQRGLPEKFESIPDIQMWQAISPAGVRQTHKLHIVMPAGGIELLQRFAGV